jgi:hypothetical protein
MNFLRNLFSKSQKEEAVTPSAEYQEQAKKIFIEYSCNPYYMSREGINFSQYHIAKEREAEWRNEFITEWISKLSTDDLTAVHKLEGASAIEAVPDLLAIADKGDSYVKLWVANAIWTISFKDDMERALQKQTRDAAMELLELIIASQVQLSENHKKAIPSEGIKNLHASTPEEYIVNYAKRLLKEAKK